MRFAGHAVLAAAVDARQGGHEALEDGVAVGVVPVAVRREDALQPQHVAEPVGARRRPRPVTAASTAAAAATATTPFFLLGVCLIAKDLFLRLFNSSRFASSISVKTVTWCKSEILSINSSL